MKHTIYQTNNTVNDKIYIGVHATENPDEFDGYLGSGDLLKLAIKKYGKDKFTRKILHVFETSEEAYLKEREIVNPEFVKRDDTYNLVVGGEGCEAGENNPMFGQHHLPETIKKMSEAHIGEKNHFYGQHHKEDSLKKMSESHSGFTHTEESKKMMSESHQGENNHFYGQHHLPETIKKMSEAKKGIPLSEEHKQNLSKNSGRKLSLKIIDQRRQDIKNISHVHGWRSQIAKKWGIGPSSVWKFFEKYAADLVDISEKYHKPTPDIIAQRRLDIQNEPKIFGWQSQLAVKWDIGSCAVRSFILKYTPDLANTGRNLVQMSLETVKQRRQDIYEIPKICGWRQVLTKKWKVDRSTVRRFIKNYASDLMKAV